MWWILLCLACGGPSRSAWKADFADDPAGTLTRVAAITDPLEQEAVVLALVEAWPGQTARLCEALQDTAVRDRCTRFNSRPHLWTPVRASPGGPRTRPAGGPAGENLVFSTSALSHWDTVAPDPGPCQPATPRFSLCLVDRAVEAVVTGDVDTAASRCRAEPEELLRQDCFFTAAETVDRHRVLGWSLHLCLGSGTFAAECTAHALQAMVLVDEAGLRSQEPDLPRLVGIAAELPAGEIRDLFWAIATWTVVALDPAPEDITPPGLPPEAVSHHKDALAWRFRAGVSPEWVGTSGHAPGGVTGTWVSDLPGEETIPSAWFLGLHGGRRPVDPDPEVDLALATLTAALAYTPPAIPLLVAETDARRPAVVRWTALRMLQAASPEHPRIGALVGDPEPLVRQRASLRPGR